MVVRRKDWYKYWFGNEYLTVYAHRDESEARALVDLIEKNIVIKSEHLVLDLCCGQGRHALLLAAKGYQVIGVDLSRTLLEIAKFRADPQQRPRFVQADMRSLPFNSCFDILLNLFTSFGYFEEDYENHKVFEQFYQVLKPEGYFVFDYFNAQHVAENLIAYQLEETDDHRIELERRIVDTRVEKKIILTKADQRTTFFESVKMYRPDEIFRMLARANLEVDEVYGDYSGIPFKTDTPRLLIIGKKAEK